MDVFPSIFPVMNIFNTSLRILHDLADIVKIMHLYFILCLEYCTCMLSYGYYVDTISYIIVFFLFFKFAEVYTVS